MAEENMLDRLFGLQRSLVDETETLLAKVAGLDNHSGTREQKELTQALIRFAEQLEAAAALVAELPQELPLDEAEHVRAALRRIIDRREEIKAAIDRMTVRAVRGQVDKIFRILSVLFVRRVGYGTKQQLIAVADRMGALVKAPLSGSNPRTIHPPGMLASAPPPSLGAPSSEEAPRPAPPTPGQEARQHPSGPEVPAEAPSTTARTEPLPLDFPAAFSDVAAGLPDEPSFERCLRSLLAGDDLDQADALADLLRRHQHQLVASLIRGAAEEDPQLRRTMDVLWANADVILLDDYFFSTRRSKLAHVLSLAEPYPAAVLFSRLLKMFVPTESGYAPPSDVFATVEREVPAHLPVFLRCFLVHPLEVYRRFAATRLEIPDFWPVVAFPQAPPAALLAVLERLALPSATAEQRKIFFDCTLSTLTGAEGMVQIRAARRILDILFDFEFFMEDEYFDRLMGLHTTIEGKENRVGIPIRVFRESLRLLREQKARLGPRRSAPPSFVGIPLVVQRKLARDGVYLDLFAQHPDPRIALETVRFITTPTRAEQVVRLSNVNGRLLTELSKKEHLFGSYGASLALVSSPRANLRAVQRYIPMLRADDLRRLATSHDTNPEVAAFIRNQLQRHEQVSPSSRLGLRTGLPHPPGDFS
jgi:hypothetical protein